MKLGTAQKIELSSFAQIHFSGSVFIARSRIFAVFVSKRAIRGPSAVFLLKRIDCVEYEGRVVRPIVGPKIFSGVGFLSPAFNLNAYPGA
jgi:hypothetical protein